MHCSAHSAHPRAHAAASLFLWLALGVLGPAYAAPPLTVSDAWVRATPGAEVAAAYFTLHNPGPVPISVVGVSSPLAGMAMIHETRLTGTQTSMRARDAVPVPAGATVRFAPEGLHVMLHDLHRPLNVGEEVPLVLVLSDGSSVSVSARVRPLTAP